MFSWYHKWNEGDNPVMWIIRTTLIKMNYAGLTRLHIGQIYKFTDMLK